MGIDDFGILICIGQIISHIGDFIFNSGKGFGIILMITIICHLLNEYIELVR